MAEQKITDLSYLQDISMGDDTLIAEMIGLFLENAPPAIESLKSLAREENWPMLAAAAHKFKPNLSYMGLNSAKEELEKLEKNAKNRDDLDKIPSQIGQIEEDCKQSYAELTEVLRGIQE